MAKILYKLNFIPDVLQGIFGVKYWLQSWLSADSAKEPLQDNTALLAMGLWE